MVSPLKLGFAAQHFMQRKIASSQRYYELKKRASVGRKAVCSLCWLLLVIALSWRFTRKASIFFSLQWSDILPFFSFFFTFSPFLPQEVDIEGRVRLVMESALTARDRVGVQDFVLLENHNSEAAFIENLRRRFRENLIYVTKPVLSILFLQNKHSWCEEVWMCCFHVLAQTYIGSVLVSVNPYKELGIYSKQQMERYRGVSFYEISPHMWVASHTLRYLFPPVFCCQWSTSNIKLFLIIM